MRFAGKEKKRMRVTFPHLGNAYIAIEALLQGLGHEPVTPPLSTKRTIEWGSRYSPEDICLPFKTILGNMLEGIELGADSVYMLGGWGPCRLGYYAEIQRIILLDLGKQVEFVTLEVPWETGPGQGKAAEHLWFCTDPAFVQGVSAGLGQAECP